MNLLTAEKIRKSFGNRVLLNDISFSVQEGDKIGLIGVNGTGKSTLLKITAGVEEADSGQIVTRNDIRMAYLPQNPIFRSQETVLDYIFQANGEVGKLLSAYFLAEKQLAENPNDRQAADTMANLAPQMERAQAWSLESEAKTILTKLGIEEYFALTETLSGGQRKRVALAAVLLSPADLLFLDEPTNHIDNDTIEWLEEYLAKYPKAIFMVTHDRYFLDRVTNRILELEHGNIYSYEANYSAFLEMKAQREELEMAEERKRQNFLRTELKWIRRGAQARSTKQKARLQRFEQISQKQAPKEKKQVALSSTAGRLGKKTIEAEHISKGYDGKMYIREFSYILLRGDRIGIVGDNGCGKSTLVRLLSGMIQPDSGTVVHGETVRIGVFAQENHWEDESVSVLDYIREAAEQVWTEDGRITASQLLEKFLFSMDMQRGPISMLSGGEKRRLYLCRVLMESPNVLFLDEPTNDLDIETLRILEDYLDRFSGAVVVVSHDRYFLDRVTERIFAFMPDGQIKQFEGGWSDYHAAKEAQQERKEAPKQADAPKEKPAKRNKLSYKDQRELDGLDAEMEALEKKIAQLEQEMTACATDYSRLETLSEQKMQAETELEEKMNRWVYLTELAEQFQRETGANGEKE